MKTEFLKSLNLDDDVIKQIQAESGKDVTAAKTQLQAQIDALNKQLEDVTGQVNQRDADLTSLRSQLEEAGQSATKLSQVQKSFADLQTKYEADTKKYQEKLQKQSYEFAVQQAIGEIQFSSKAAKSAFTRALIEKNLPLQDGKLLGFSDYIEEQKQVDPDAFKKDEQPDPKKSPNFAPPPDPSNNLPKDNENQFGFNFLGVRKHE
ncbi:MAG: phage scaffolding protein [Bacteroidales bacterium]|nr:phage scaffolding protein [Bacteroidales bacterium]